MTVEQEKLAFKVSAILRSKGSKDNLALKRTDSLSSVNILKEGKKKSETMCIYEAETYVLCRRQ